MRSRNRPLRPATTVVALMATVVTAIGLTACSDDGESAGATREINDIRHSGIRVPAQPTKVVTLSEPALDAALAMGFTPVGTVAARGLPGVADYLKDKAKDIPVVSAVGNPDFEKIANLHPDLILTDGTSLGARQDALEILQKIAPVVYAGNAGGDWKPNLTIVGDALNKGEDAKKVIADYDAKTGALKTRLAPKYGDKSFSVVRWQGSGAGLILKELLSGQALTDLGLKRPPAQDREGPGHSEPVATEKLGDIDADYMFFGTLGGSSVGNPDGGGESGVAAARAALDKAKQVPGFAALKATRDDHVIPVDGYWTSAGGPILMSRIVDDIAQDLP